MINLEKYAGLPIQMKDDFILVFGQGLSEIKSVIRDFSAMRNYLKDPFASYPRRAVYRIYRDVALDADRENIHAANLEYDLTVIPPGKIGGEFVKTIGHYHPLKPGTKVRYPEVYEVIYGKFFLLLQSASEDLERLQETYIIEAGRGEKIVVPPGFGHASINPTDEVLVLANWQLLRQQGIYEPYEVHNGAAYYVIDSSRLSAKGALRSEPEFAPNLSYQKVPELKRRLPRELPQYDLRFALPMYFTGVKNLGALDFLINPENYLDDLVPEKLFK